MGMMGEKKKSIAGGGFEVGIGILSIHPLGESWFCNVYYDVKLKLAAW